MYKKLAGIFLIVCLICSIFSANARCPEQVFDVPAYYKILKTGSLTEINNELDLIRASSLKERKAYEGTLLMKKAGSVKVPAVKMHVFKDGYIKLETAISNNKKNIEYRFLRLIIQEHAPKIVRYRRNLGDDSKLIKDNFASLSPELQQIVIDYSKTSAVLHAEDFNFTRNE